MDAQRARVLGNPDGPPVGIPQLSIGSSAQLRHKPGKMRRILRAEWHFKKQAWTYIVETERTHPIGFEPKFTGDQLSFERELVDSPTDNQALRRTQAAKKRTWLQRLFRRCPGH
jgi:hypothetical protein